MSGLGCLAEQRPEDFETGLFGPGAGFASGASAGRAAGVTWTMSDEVAGSGQELIGHLEEGGALADASGIVVVQM